MTKKADYWLSLDLSSPVGTLAIHREGACPQLVLEHTLGEDFQHTERLLPAINESLGEAHLCFKSLSRFIAVTGPGSFTGLRVAMASLKGFAMVTQLPIDTVSAAEARALTWIREHRPTSLGTIWVLTHVSMGRFVASHFAIEENGALCLLEERVRTELSFGDTTPPAIVLNDSRVPADLVHFDPVIPFPLRARMLAECLAQASSRRTHQSLAEWIALSPEYFGAEHYR